MKDNKAFTFKDLKVWEKAHSLVLEIYKQTKKFPDVEKYGLTSQLRRSAASVATNIVEGYKRKSKKDFSHFLSISEGSLEETKYHLLLSHDLKYLKSEEYKRLSDLTEEVGRMLAGFQKTLRNL